MEAIAAAATICAICKSIEVWVGELAEKEAIVNQLTALIAQIRNVLLPFTSAEFRGIGESQLYDCLCSLGDVLQRTKEHLMIWQHKRSRKIVVFLSPATMIKDLQDDERQLNQQLLVLLTSVAVVGYFRQHQSHVISSLTVQNIRISEAQPPNLVDQVESFEAREFWRDYIGAKISFAPKEHFSSRLILWSQGSLSQATCDLMVLRLDEFNVGGVTPENLSRALEGKTLNDFVRDYANGVTPIGSNDSTLTVTTSDDELRTPLLVWIDDSPANNAYEVAQARSMGINVVELTSTPVAKAWVEANSAFLRDHGHPSRIRFISDNVRAQENPDGTYTLNPAAGEIFLRFLRGRLYEIPVLIYTGATIDSTRYVESFSLAGSTAFARTCLHYISGLAVGESGDTSWRGFKSF